MRRAESALVLLLAAIWGAVYPLTTVALRQVSPQGVVLARTAAAALVLIPFAIRSGVLQAARRRWPGVLAAAALQATIPLVLSSAPPKGRPRPTSFNIGCAPSTHRRSVNAGRTPCRWTSM